MPYFFKKWSVLVCLFLPIIGVSQTTTACFKIESILIDACGNDEGNNEMVRFLVGPAALNSADLNVVWATLANPWGGVCQDGTTAQKVAALNATIESCGLILEPVGGILPANSKVLLISGINFNPANNSFAGLSDTLYVIFNCASPGTGNFANGGSGIRNFSMTFSAPPSCTESVSYDRSLLIGGDGATINYASAGNPTYTNDGCIAPFTPLSAAWTVPQLNCTSQPIDLSTLVTGTPGGTFTGTGVTGSLFDPSAVSGGSSEVTYTVGSGACQISEVHTITITSALPLPVLQGDTSICTGEQIQTLLITNAGNYTVNWFADAALTTLIQTGSSILPTGSATYYIQFVDNGCSSQVLAVHFTLTATPASPTGNITINYCTGDVPSPITLNGPNLIWYSDSLLTTLLHQGPVFQPLSPVPAHYWVVASQGDCKSDAVKLTLIESDAVEAYIYIDGEPVICGNGSIELVSSSPDNNTWSTGETTPSIQVSQPGTYSLSVQGGCNVATAGIVIEADPVTAQIQIGDTIGFAPFTLQASGISSDADTCSWLLNNQPFPYNSGTPFVLAEPGTYSLLYRCTGFLGCIASDSVKIVVTSDKVELKIPNSFTPNGDDINDFFSFEIAGFKELSGTIFNRWGQKVFSWSGLQPDWNGTINGAAATEGVYFYVVNGVDINEKSVSEKGSVTLIRN